MYLALKQLKERLCQEILVSPLTLVACRGGLLHSSSSLHHQAWLEAAR